MLQFQIYMGGSTSSHLDQRYDVCSIRSSLIHYTLQTQPLAHWVNTIVATKDMSKTPYADAITLSISLHAKQ